jgi:hypothetical protein
VLAFDSSTRDFYSTNNTAVIATFADVLRAYDINGANGVDVHTTLTNVNTIATGHVARVDNPHSVTAAQVGADPAGTSTALTNGCATGTDLSGNVFSNGLIKTVGTAFTSAGTGEVQTVVNAMSVLTNGNLTISYSNDMLYFNIPLATCTGIVWNIGGTNILMKKDN